MEQNILNLHIVLDTIYKYNKLSDAVLDKQTMFHYYKCCLREGLVYRKNDMIYLSASGLVRYKQDLQIFGK